MHITQKFRNRPTAYYALSICATWANAGSLLNGVSIARGSGLLPFLLWALGNTAACIVFGLAAPRIPKLREVFRSRTMKLVMGIMCPFQCWISMNGIREVFAETAAGEAFGGVIAIGIAAVFLLLLLRHGMIRNVLSDHLSWIAVYALVFGLTICAFLRGPLTPVPMGADGLAGGLKNCLLLLPGAFLYPYYYEILDYNEENADGTRKINTTRAFCFGGLAFGIYLIFIFAMALATFSPAMALIRAVLVTLIAASSLSSFLYSLYLSFGRTVGLVLGAATVGLWPVLIPLGVMGAWTLMASIRIYIVIAAILAALAWNAYERKEAAE